MSKKLPVNPNSEHLRNQAKALLKSHRKGLSEANSRILEFHPKWSRSSVSQIHHEGICLSDAQWVIAREYGFDSWAQLKHHIEARRQLIAAVLPHNSGRRQATANEQDKQNIESCIQHLMEIGNALKAYQKDHGDFPLWLSDMYPDYLTDEKILICSADKAAGSPAFSSNKDPKLAVSYDYQLSPSRRELKSAQRNIYGDIVPLVRCWHHTSEEGLEPVINLSHSFELYDSRGIWEEHPRVVGQNSKGGSKMQASKSATSGKNHREKCKKNLERINQAIVKYKEEHGEVPNWLSDLYPKYVSDPDLLICPADTSEPKGSRLSHSNFRPFLQDPEMPCSYIYQFAPAEGYRGWKIQQLKEFGDKIPVVRCWWHIPESGSTGRPVINLSYGGEIYESGTLWEDEVASKEEKSPPDRDEDINKQDERKVEACEQNLIKIGQALAAYQKEHGRFPDWLSDLYPEYLSDKQFLLCPADERGGKPILSGNADPKLPVSYGYQFHPSYREWKTQERQLYGDIIPVARCRHHGDFVLDLTCAFEVRNDLGKGWENIPQVRENVLSNLKTRVRAGVSNGQTGLPLDLRFYLPRFAAELCEKLGEFAQGIIESEPDNGAAIKILAQLRLVDRDIPGALGLLEKAMPLLTRDAEVYSIAGELYEQSQRLEEAIAAFETTLQIEPENPRYFRSYSSLCRLYTQVSRDADANALIARFSSLLDPDSADSSFILGDMLMTTKQYDQALAVFEKLSKQSPGDRNVLLKLADVHEALGDAASAKEYRIKVDPALAWVGEELPDFSAIDSDGNQISLSEYRGKVILLDFWAAWCGPCVGEMPNVKKVYEKYHDRGFDIIGVSLDNNEAEFRDFIRENNLPWRQVFSGQGWNSPIARQFQIRAIPAPWLIDRDGKLVSPNARGTELERLVAEEL